MAFTILEDYQPKGIVKLPFGIYINSLGFRNEEYNISKSQDTFRIVFLGDSFVYGYGVDLHKTFFKILEKRLNGVSDKKIEVWNIGVPSWSTIIQYLIVKQKLRHYDPDYVILMFDRGDFYGNIVYESLGVYKDGELVSVEHGNLSELEIDKAAAGLRKKIFAGSNRDLILANHLVLQQDAISYILKINDILKNESAGFEVITYPSLNESAYFEEGYMSHFHRSLEENNITYHTLTPFFAQKEKYYSPIDKHWNEKGSEFVAGLLYDIIIDDTDCCSGKINKD